jgi:hypothetical protein
MKRNLIRFRPLLFFLIVVLIGIPFFLYAQDYKYVASKFSIKYHKPNCRRALKIQPQNRVTFKTAKQALDAGYMPCPVCKTPNKEMFKEKKEFNSNDQISTSN